jgi:hypothetical protein
VGVGDVGAVPDILGGEGDSADGDDGGESGQGAAAPCTQWMWEA